MGEQEAARSNLGAGYKLMLSLHTHSKLEGAASAKIYKVLGISKALEANLPFDRILVDQRNGDPLADIDALRKIGFAGIVANHPFGVVPKGFICLSELANNSVVACGDVIRVRDRGQVTVLFRRGANANFFLATERCNSYCLMCSQPPRDELDDWRINEILDVVPLVDRDSPQLGITGGEPTLLGSRLARVIQAVTEYLPSTQLNVLTNGRLFADPALADVLTIPSSNVLWAVPLYSDIAARHDFVVQAEGAFEETINGLYNLAERSAAIELRMVVHAQTIERLLQYSEFVWRSLPFVAHVAFMGLEPMGFAKRNRELLYVDPADYHANLESAAWYLHNRGISTSIYNTPLCVLSKDAWPLAKRSISDWKNSFPPECASCNVRERCGGFFKSAGPGWRSRAIHPIKEVINHAA